MYVVYSINKCQYCTKAMELLTERGEEFEVINIEANPTIENCKNSYEKTGWKTWPQIFHDGEFVGGYAELKKWKQNEDD